MRISIIMIVLLLMAGLAYAIVEDPNLKVRDSTNYDINAPDTNFLNQNPDPAEPGGYVEIRVKIENLGTVAATDLTFEVIPDYPFSLDPGKNPQVMIGDTDARQVGENAYVLFWKLRIDKDAVEGNNRIRMKYSYNDGMTWVDLDDYFVRIQTHDAIVSVDSVETEPEIVAPGEEFKLKVTLSNMADSLIKDVQTSLTLLYAQSTIFVELPFTPIGSTNTKTVKQMSPGEKRTLEFDMIADVDAASGIYKVPISISYSDTLAENYTKNGIIGIKVGQEPDLFVSIDRATGSAGSEMDMTVRFVNKGQEDINYLFTKLGEQDGFEILSPQEVYIGNVDSDDFETEDFTIKVDKCDTAYKVPIRVEYKSTSNVLYDKEYLVEFTACRGSDNSNGSSGKSTMYIVIIIVVAIVSIVLYRKMKKKKKA